MSSTRPSDLGAYSKTLQPQHAAALNVIYPDVFGRPHNAANTASPVHTSVGSSDVGDSVQAMGSAVLATAVNEVKYEDEAMAGPTHGEVDAKIAAAEARGKIDIARFEGKLETLTATLVGKIEILQTSLSSKVEDVQKSIVEADKYNRDTRLFILGTIVTSALALLTLLGALIVGMASYGDALFGRGMDVRDVVQEIVQEVQKRGAIAQPPSLPKPSDR
jgi:hypothetical protein